MNSQRTAIALLLLTASLFAQEPSRKTTEKTEPVVFRDIKFVGVKQLPIAPLRRVAALYEGKPLKGSDLSELAERIRQVYQEHGFFMVQIYDPEASQSSTSPIVYTIEEGRRYRLKTMKFSNAKAFPASALRPLFLIQAGEIFNTAKIRKGLESLRKLYGTKGYINFTPVPDTKVDEAAGTVSLEIDLDEGKQFRIGSVKIFGLDWDRTTRLLCGWPLKPGAIYRPDVIQTFFWRNKTWLSQDALNRMETVPDEKASTLDVLLNFSSGQAPGIEIEARPEIVYVPEKPRKR